MQTKFARQMFVTNDHPRVLFLKTEIDLKERPFGFMSFCGPNVIKTFKSFCL